ncbi:hypothetical protein GCM10010967_16540 [Dyadobacter beijingensis]|uniref:Uncharacterized protein n=1 Tax=Dyadobacter beijingensis TaxID=365489 RepID=A0ABQ2HLC3_9BACT|nr:hypothetical protein GCM10010967_16540 [Dyadobacter beijingensis]
MAPAELPEQTSQEAPPEPFYMLMIGFYKQDAPAGAPRNPRIKISLPNRHISPSPYVTGV